MGISWTPIRTSNSNHRSGFATLQHEAMKGTNSPFHEKFQVASRLQNLLFQKSETDLRDQITHKNFLITVMPEPNIKSICWIKQDQLNATTALNTWIQMIYQRNFFPTEGKMLLDKLNNYFENESLILKSYPLLELPLSALYCAGTSFNRRQACGMPSQTRTFRRRANYDQVFNFTSEYSKTLENKMRKKDFKVAIFGPIRHS